MSSNWSSLVTETQLMLFLKRKAREVQPEVERPNIEPRWWEYCERYWLTSTKPSLPLKMCEVNWRPRSVPEGHWMWRNWRDSRDMCDVFLCVKKIMWAFKIKLGCLKNPWTALDQLSTSLPSRVSESLLVFLCQFCFSHHLFSNGLLNPLSTLTFSLLLKVRLTILQSLAGDYIRCQKNWGSF